MTRFAQMALILLTVAFGASACVVRPRPFHQGHHAHSHFKGCGHHVKAVVVVR
jgi:hypothetical protein